MGRRTQWKHFLPNLVGGAVVFVVVVMLSGHTARNQGWLLLEAGLGAVALATAAEAAIAWACAGLKTRMLWRGLAQIVLGGVLVMISVIHVSPGGDQGRALLWAELDEYAGMLLAAYGIALAVAGWSVRPSALARLPGQFAEAERQAQAAQRESGGAPPAGVHDLNVAEGALRIGLAVFTGLFGVVCLALTAFCVLFGLSNHASDPQPAAPFVTLGLVGFAGMLVCLDGVVFLTRMRTWLDGTTVHAVRPLGVKAADLAAVTGAVLRPGTSAGAQPWLKLAGSGNLRHFPLGQWRGRKLLPPGDIVLIANALAANPLATQLQGTIDGLRELAGVSIGHHRVREPRQHQGSLHIATAEPGLEPGSPN